MKFRPAGKFEFRRCADFVHDNARPAAVGQRQRHAQRRRQCIARNCGFLQRYVMHKDLAVAQHATLPGKRRRDQQVPTPACFECCKRFGNDIAA